MRYIVIVCFILSPVMSMAQNNGPGNWILAFGNKQLTEKFNWHHEVQYRNYNAIGDLEQLLLRTGIGMNITDKTNILQGYGFIRSENYINQEEKVVVNEHRLYQQLITRQKFKGFNAQHRYRFEQRFVEDQFKLRFRYFLALSYSVYKFSNNDSSLYLSAYNEIFLNTTGTVFDRNRLYGGVGYKLNKNLRFELGYMNQFFSSGGRDQINIVTFFNW